MKKYLICLIFICLSSVNAKVELTKELGLQSLSGKKMELKEKRQLLYFWATWCTSCLPKMKTILPEMIKKENIEIVTVNMDRNEKKITRYLNKKKITIAVARDKKGIFEKALKIKSLPHWAVIERSKDGWVVLEHEEGFDKDKISKYFSKTK